jgi:hypothetical protein
VFHIEEIQAPLDDRAALARLLASTPWPESVQGLLRRPFFARKWDITRQTDRWLASDGATAVLLTITGATASAVAGVRLRFDDLRIKSTGLLPCRETVGALLERIAREDDPGAGGTPDAQPGSRAR